MTTNTHSIDRAKVTECDNGIFIVEASNLGLRAGEWPERMETTMGNKMPFLRRSKKVVDGDLFWVTYLQGNGSLILRIFND